ncbi:MAG: hypothetical protein JOZ55_11190 [Alphaproteobacteria bacterium]|nr:hypothetical protein [Alphaproteobacteria bacterium]
MKHIIRLAAVALATVALSGCYYYGDRYGYGHYGYGGYYDDYYGPDYGPYYDGYYDGYYGPYYGGYWGVGGDFYWYDRDHHAHRDSDHHFQHQNFQGSTHIQSERGMDRGDYRGMGHTYPNNGDYDHGHGH